MASETVNKILEAEAEAEKKNAEARRRAEEIISSAESKAAIAVQKKLTDAKAESERIRQENKEKLAEFAEAAENKCSEQLEALKKNAEKNMDAAVGSIIKEFFS